jgi:colanic acid/amylovoran biosynthesis glycosyltransferase
VNTEPDVHRTRGPETRGPRPRILVICPHLGMASEPWLWRQVVGLQHFRASVITAERHNSADYPTSGITVLQDRLVRPQEIGLARWGHRLRRLARRNFFALDHQQVDHFTELAVKEPPDVLLCHFGHIAVRFLPLARRLNIPLVAHFHGMDLSSSLRNRWYRWSLEVALPEFAAVIVVGSHQRALVESMGYPPERLHQIPCGVPVDDFTSRPVRKPDGRTRFITVCRLVPWKGVDVSIRALAQLRRDDIDAELRVVGDGPEREALQRLAAQLEVADRVHFHGSLTQEEVHRQLGEADVFLQHSREHGGWVEGFGVSITEAAATGLPVIVSDCGGIIDQVEDEVTGYVVEQGDVDAMADRMGRLAEDPELRRSLGLTGSHRARERFNTPGQIEKLELAILQTLR